MFDNWEYLGKKKLIEIDSDPLPFNLLCFDCSAFWFLKSPRAPWSFFRWFEEVALLKVTKRDLNSPTKTNHLQAAFTKSMYAAVS